MGTIDTILTETFTKSVNVTKSAYRAAYYFTLFLKNLPKRMAKQRSREALSQLNDDQLRDIGVTRKEAEEEAAKPFWD